MSKKICPLMSRPLNAIGAYDQQVVETVWVDCQKEICQLWATVYTTEHIQIQGCSLELNAHKNQDGQYAV